MRTWIIGSGADCDVVVAQPRVSGRHCRFTERAGGFLVEDLGSSNGTYVNGERITEEARVLAGDRITLGAIVPMPWPPSSGVPGATVIRIGRTADNDVVLDDSRVSSHHARLLVRGTRTLIEDLGSSNGTFLNSPEQRVTQATELTGADTVYFGSLAVPATRLLPAPPMWEEEAAPLPPPIPQRPVVPAAAPVPPSPEPAPISAWTILVLAQAPVIAILIPIAFGRQVSAPATATGWPTVAEGIASTMFALALAAVWLGGSLAAWSSLAGRSVEGRKGSIEGTILGSAAATFAVLGVLCVTQCALLLAMVYWGTGLSGPLPSMFGVLLLAAAVGLSLGLAINALIRSPGIAAAVLILCFAAMIVLGGRIWRLPPSSPAARIAAVAPTRWAFEGLLLLESHGHAPSVDPGEAAPDRTDDLAEDFFPAGSERMGPNADAMALASMLIGLSGAAAFISSGSKPWR